MHSAGPQHEMVYSNEVLLAKLAIRDHYFDTAAKEIYENVGQLLSLVRIQLAAIPKQEEPDINTKISNSGDIIGKVIRDLRDMTRFFFPESKVLSESGLADALKQELLAGQDDNGGIVIKIKGVVAALPSGSGLIFFQVILEVLALLNHTDDNKLHTAELEYTKNRINMKFVYSGTNIDFDAVKKNKDNSSAVQELNIQERLMLIGGVITMEAGNAKKKKLIISWPFS